LIGEEQEAIPFLKNTKTSPRQRIQARGEFESYPSGGR